MKKLALLSVSALVVSGGAIAANIPAIAHEYPAIREVYVELLSTIPSLFIILTVLISPKIGRVIGYKNTVQLGIATVLVAGISPVVTTSFAGLFVSRIFFGIGIGLLNPLLYTFASVQYKGRELATVIGLQSAFEGVGGMLITFIVGQLLMISWRASFLSYLLAVPILILFSLFVPQIDGPKENTREMQADKSFSRQLSLYVLLLVIIVTVYMSVTVKVTSLLIFKEIGDATEGSNLIALVGLGAMLAGISFGKIYDTLKTNTLSISFLTLGMAMIIMGFSFNMVMASAAAILCGFSFRTFIPYLFNAINQDSITAEKNTSVLLIAFNIGAAFAPISIAAIQNGLPVFADEGLFIGEGIMMMLLAVGVFLIKTKKNQSERKKR